MTASGEEIEKYVDEMLTITPKAKELLSFLLTKGKNKRGRKPVAY
jgi:hypothetical protein